MASLESIRSQTIASHQYLIAWTTILAWDWLALLPSEYRHIWKARWTPLKIVFLLNRYGVLVGQILSTAMILATVSKDLCEKIFWFETAALIYAIMICDVLLAIRVWALYERSRKILISLCLMLTVELALIVAVGSETKPVNIPPPIAIYIGLQGCLTGDYRGKHEGFAYMLSCAPFAVNATLLGMVVYKSWKITREVGAQLPILRRMVQDGVGYFLAITVFNFINIYFYAQHIESIKVFNVCASVVIGSTLSCRLALSLLENKPAVATFASFPPPSKPLSHQIPLPPTLRFDVQPANVRLNRQESDETVTEKDEEARIEGVESMPLPRSKEVDEEVRIKM